MSKPSWCSLGSLSSEQNVRVAWGEGHGVGRFDAMASPCEILVERNADLGFQADGLAATRELTHLAAREVWRIEAKFSRYRADSVLTRLHAAQGEPFEVDAETADLLDFAARCYEISNGAFDVTSGVLRRVWHFDGSDRIPSRDAVAAILPLVGWSSLTWRRPTLTLPRGMELDFGGFGKEYAADRVAGLLAKAAPQTSILVNLGGDLCVTRPRREGRPWVVGIEDPAQTGIPRVLEIRQGALCTSGDARRFLRADGVRYGHILDPRTGWPPPNAPRSVTVVAATCTEAGLLSTLAMLAGAGAQEFLAAQGVPFWVI